MVTSIPNLNLGLEGDLLREILYHPESLVASSDIVDPIRTKGEIVGILAVSICQTQALL